VNSTTLEHFRKSLANWYDVHKRTLPWRDINCAYRIWVSEIILQQTTVEQGLSYYERFIDKYPDIFSLASASEHDVLKLWQGLGYYSRARHMHKTAQDIVKQFNGVFPSSYEVLIKFKGIGSYTAAAILSFAYNLPYPVVDGNVLRVISRLFAIEEAVNTTAGLKIVKEKTHLLFDKKNPAIFNQAIMEFGALHCKVRQPLCDTCFACAYCNAYQKNIQQLLPVKKEKKISRNRYFMYLVPLIKTDGIIYTYIRKRPPNDIWQGLYDFILFETPVPVDAPAFLKSKNYSGFLKDNSLKKKQITPEIISKTYIHKLTHQNIYACFIVLHANDAVFSENYLRVPWQTIDSYPLPKLIDNFIKDNLLKILFG